MKKSFLKTRSVTQATWILGFVGLTSLSLLNNVNPVNAASLACGTGNNWVATCQSGSYDFSNSLTNFLNIFGPNNQPDFEATRSGRTTIFIGSPVDAIIDDPLLGDVGSIDGKLDVLKFEISSSTSSGDESSTPFPFPTSAILGDGVPDLAPTPPDSTLPFESLYSAGAIIQRQDNPALADSFLKVFLEAEGFPQEPLPEPLSFTVGPLRNREPITATTVTPLTEFPSQITYVSTEITPLFLAGSDGVFWTGDETEFERLVPGPSGRVTELSLTPVPEPSTVLSSIFIGLGIMMFRRKKTANL